MFYVNVNYLKKQDKFTTITIQINTGSFHKFSGYSSMLFSFLKG